MELDDLIDIYVRGTTADELRDAVAAQAYRSGFADTGCGAGNSSHDAMMVALADRMPGRYAPSIIDQVQEGFAELRRARPVRYQVVVYDHVDTRTRTAKALQVGLSEVQYKNELRMGREYLGVRFIDLLVSSDRTEKKQCQRPHCDLV